MPGSPDQQSAGRVLVTWPGYALDAAGSGAELTAHGLDIVLAPKHGPRAEDELIRLAGGCDAVIASTDPFSARVLHALPDLRVIARVGVGLDSIDLPAATACGVIVTAARGANEETVADHTLALILGSLRRIVAHDAAVREGRWDRGGPYSGSDLHGKTVGLVGLGAIGRAVAQRLVAFQVELIAHDPYVQDAPSVTLVPLADLLRRSDVVSLHLPLSEATRNLFGRRELSMMKPGAVLVNTARGGIIDESSLVDALRSGHLSMAALDVFEDEPPRSSELLGLRDRTLLTPHVAGLTFESIAAMERHATSAVLSVLEGRWPDDVANPEVRSSRGTAASTA